MPNNVFVRGCKTTQLHSECTKSRWHHMLTKTWRLWWYGISESGNVIVNLLYYWTLDFLLSNVNLKHDFIEMFFLCCRFIGVEDWDGAQDECSWGPRALLFDGGARWPHWSVLSWGQQLILWWEVRDVFNILGRKVDLRLDEIGLYHSSSVLCRYSIWSVLSSIYSDEVSPEEEEEPGPSTSRRGRSARRGGAGRGRAVYMGSEAAPS